MSISFLTRPAERDDAAVTGRVWEALRTVRDPELDNDVVSLDFVASLVLDENRVAHVRLRLPTYFCAPNFAFLMVADAWDAVSTVEGLTDVDVELIDHFAADAINRGVAARAGFVHSMAGTEVGEAVEELDTLRRQFTERALMAGTDLVVRPLVKDGRTPEELAAMTLGDAPESADLVRLRARRRELGIPSSDDDPLVVDPSGKKVGVEALPLHLRKARSFQVGVDANTSICRGQLAVRYGL
jgi:metal-sulfur cluster biosynthetic enzyme